MTKTQKIKRLRGEIKADLSKLLVKHKRIQKKLVDLASLVLPKDLPDHKLTVALMNYDLDVIIADIHRREARERIEKDVISA